MPDHKVPAFFFILTMKSAVRFFFFLHLSILIQSEVNSQSLYNNDFLSSSFHKNRREELRKLMPDSAIAILFSAPVRNRSNDNDFQYHQSPDFYYLTGLAQPHAILLILKKSVEVLHQYSNEFLFIAPRNKDKEIWTGKIKTLEEMKEIAGMNSVFLTTDFYSLSISDKDFSQVLYTILPKGIADIRNDTLDLFDLVNVFKTKFSFPPDNGDSFLLPGFLKKLREIKEAEEIVLMKKAISMSCEAHKEMMRVAKPGMTEYQVQASGEYVFKSMGSEFVGYPSICGGGENSCILHYETNRKKLVDGDLILLDMGAEYHGYTADVTRTLPVNGTFNKEQRLIYELVKTSQDSAFAKCKPGNEFNAPHQAAVSVIKSGLLSLGIIKDESEYKKYFMHGTSHYLGLDVHDAGTFSALKPGNVITVEPGIYIPLNSPCDSKWWNIGVRIEDDVLITSTGYENLSAQCPSDIKEVEEMMKQNPMFLKEDSFK